MDQALLKTACNTLSRKAPPLSCTQPASALALPPQVVSKLVPSVLGLAAAIKLRDAMARSLFATVFDKIVEASLP